MRRAVLTGAILLLVLDARAVFVFGWPAAIPIDVLWRQQQTAPTFRAASTYIRVDAHVFDKDGQFVRGLKKEDFRVTQDGQVQEVEQLALVDSSDTLDSAPSPSSEAAREGAPALMLDPLPSTRVYCLVIDDLHIRAERTAPARQLAADFLRRVPGARDLVGMMLTSGIGGMIRPTLLRQPLVARVPRIVGKKLRSAAIASAVEHDTMNRPRSDQARAALAALADAMRELAATAGGRKTLVLVSEGIDPNRWEGGADMGRSPGSADDAPFIFTVDEQIQEAMKTVTALANAANVSVYVLDARAVSGRLGDNLEGDVTMDVLLAEQRRSQQVLEDLAASTDGLSFVRTRNFAGAFDRIRADASTYYLLSYPKPQTSRRGYHRIEVRVSRPGVTVRARKGYDDKVVPDVR